MSAEPPSKPRVLFLNDLGFLYGAGVAQGRQVQGLLSSGWEVGVLCWETGDVEFRHVSTRAFESGLWLGMRRLNHLQPDAQNPDDKSIVAGILLEVARFRPQIAIIGNLHAARWPFGLLPALQRTGIRVIAYLHDAYLYTGRCAYPAGCQLYLTGCNETCPTATEYPPLPPERIAGQWQLRREIFNGPNGIEVAANSDWSRDMFRAALPHCRSCETVYLGTDEEVFKPGDKAAARAALGLPSDKPIVLCAAVNFQEHRKGSDYLRAIVEQLRDEVCFAAFGHNAAEIPGLIGLGYHVEAHRLATIYQSADLFLGTALQEAFGQTILEAQLSGLPAVVFQVGGVTEIVRSEITGKFVAPGDVVGAVAAIRAFVADKLFFEQATIWSRYLARPRFSVAAQGAHWQHYLGGHSPQGTGPSTPTLGYPQQVGDESRQHRPSWEAGATFVDEVHARIFDETSALPGWQLPGDSLKLYEIAYHSGDVILEIGTYGGRSATVELRGALANPQRTRPPQFYGVDIAHDSIVRTRQILADQNLLTHCHLFEGTLEQFVTRWKITPTMVFLDGDHRYGGVANDLAVLTRYLQPGTPVLMHDFLNTDNDTGKYGVTRAAREWESAGHARFLGCFGCSALYVTL